MPDNITESLDQAINFIEQGEHNQALENLLNIQSTEPNNANIAFLLASIYANQQNADAASRQFEKALTISPNFYLARFQYGFFLICQDHLDSALVQLQNLNTASDQIPDYLKAFNQALILLLTEEETQKAIELLTKGIGLNDDNRALNQDMTRVIELLTKNTYQAMEESSNKNQSDNDTGLGLSTSALLNIYN
ncbi:tetratricopeptide repeat protein [Catenovulum sp. SM1970]|uniref:tetratricopeptide repeat protein n=1 Tax=Marinifaba aquimaris TaxID=2741323 RepID=UPI001573301B|nr:tetratricopeptide repeat protein [Marinifaba aquimaris]NTS77401.1 tetratricopeptide repeat protein [Marinifaba aquimaris]